MSQSNLFNFLFRQSIGRLQRKNHCLHHRKFLRNTDEFIPRIFSRPFFSFYKFYCISLFFKFFFFLLLFFPGRNFPSSVLCFRLRNSIVVFFTLFSLTSAFFLLCVSLSFPLLIFSFNFFFYFFPRSFFSLSQAEIVLWPSEKLHFIAHPKHDGTVFENLSDLNQWIKSETYNGGNESRKRKARKGKKRKN